MKKILFILLLLLSTTIHGQLIATVSSSGDSAEPIIYDYYVSAFGDNTTGTSPATAWTTLSRVVTESVNFVAGDTIAFRGREEFYGNLTLNSGADGASGNPITLTSYGTGKAVFTGGESVTGFTQNGAYWEKTMAQVYQTFKDGNSLIQSRYPKINDDLTPMQNQLQVTSQTSSTVFVCSDLEGLFSDDHFNGSTIQMSYWDWRTAPYVVTDYVGSTGTITISGGNSSIGIDDWFYFIDDINLLTEANEWVYDGGKLKIYSILEPIGITATTFDGSGLVLNGSDYISVDNLSFRYYNGMGINVYNSDSLTISNSEFLYDYLAGVYTKLSQGTTVEDSYFKGTMENAIDINDNDTYTTITWSTITDNTIEEHGLLKQATSAIYDIPHAIRLQGQYHTATYNTMSKIGYNGFRIYGKNSIVNYNYITDFALTNHDAGAIYSTGAGNWYTGRAPENSEIKNNIIIQTVDLGDGWSDHAIYTDDATTDVAVENNVVERGRSGHFLHNNKEVISRNNSFYNQSERGILAVEAGDGTFLYQDEMLLNEIDNNDVLLLASTRSPAAYVSYGTSGNYDFGTYDYNEYWNPNFGYAVFVDVSGHNDEDWTLLEWQTDSSEDLNTGEDSGSIDDSQLVYNATKVAVNKSLVGTWEDLSGTEYIDEIILQPFTGKILIQPSAGNTNPDLITDGDMPDGTNWVEGGNTTISGGVANLVSTSTYQYLLQQQGIVGVDELSSYEITFDVLNYSSGDIRVSIGGTSQDVSGYYSANGTYTVTLQRNTGATANLVFSNGGTATTLDIDNVIMKLQ